LLTHHRQQDRPTERTRRAAWYPKPRPTFADALAAVRRELWAHEGVGTSPCEQEMVEVPRPFVERLANALCYGA